MYASELMCKVSIYKKKKKSRILLRGPENVWLISFSSFKILSCCAFLLNNWKKMFKGGMFSSKVKCGKKGKYSQNHARKLYLSILHDCLHFFLNLELKRSGEKKKEP